MQLKKWGNNDMTWDMAMYMDMFSFMFAAPRIKRPVKRYEVVIECDGTTTTAKLIVDGKEVKSTTAKKHPDDKFNLKLGMETAFGRLWEKTEKKDADPTPAAITTTTTATEPTNPKLRFKVGDRVIYTKFEAIAPHFKGKHGRIVKVGIGCAPYDYGVEFDEPAGRFEFAHNCMGHAKTSHGLWVYDYALTPEPPKEEIKPWCKSPATGNPLRFHTGDRVVVTNAPAPYDRLKGLPAKIISVEDTGYFDYTMQFDQCLIGRGVYIPISINGKDGHCLWVDDTWLEPETTETT